MSNYGVTLLASRVFFSHCHYVEKSLTKPNLLYLSLYLSIYISICQFVVRIKANLNAIFPTSYIHSQPQSSFGRPSTHAGPPPTLTAHRRRHDYCLPIGHWPHPLPAEVPEDPIEVFRRHETTFTEVVIHVPPPPTSSTPNSDDENIK